MSQKISKFTKHIIKRLPSPVGNYFYSLYGKWYAMVALDKDMVRNLAEYFNFSYQEAKCILEAGERIDAELWKIFNPKLEDDIKKFYKINTFQPFSLAFWHMTNGQRKLRSRIIELSQGNILDYGGGIGDTSLMLAKKGLDVTYADISGKTLEFAQWLMKKNNHPEIKVFDIDKDRERIWSRNYDTIISIDVVEHLLQPQKVIERMAEHLNENGRLIITGLSSSGSTDDHPMHMDINFNIDQLLSKFNIFKAKGYDWMWIKKS